jgi:hypothetical protein
MSQRQLGRSASRASVAVQPSLLDARTAARAGNDARLATPLADELSHALGVRAGFSDEWAAGIRRSMLAV